MRRCRVIGGGWQRPGRVRCGEHLRCGWVLSEETGGGEFAGISEASRIWRGRPVEEQGGHSDCRIWRTGSPAGR